MPENNKLQELRDLLYELFQIDDAAELDFGIYRIMASRRDEIKTFLDKDLLPQVETLLRKQSGADVQKTREQLDESIEQARKLGADDPELLPAVQQLRARLLQSGASAQEQDAVFSALTQFFKRYYHNGDFLSMRRYKAGVYAIPYEGEEVKLHWANADQYYIKTAEHFTNYTFMLGSQRVHFRIVQAETEKDNVKAEQGKERRFALYADEPLTAINGEPAFQFTYQVQTEKQDALSKKAVEWVKNNPARFAEKGWQNALAELLRHAPTEKQKDRTILEKHLLRYTARNTFDYFIHKDLGGFLRRELDFYIKNEILFIDNVDARDEDDFVRQLGKIKTIKAIGHKLIAFLEQLENFQKKLFLKKKFVVESNWCITLDRIPVSLYPQIAANTSQLEEWKKLFHIHELSETEAAKTKTKKKKDEAQQAIFAEDPAEYEKAKPAPYSEPLSIEFLKQHPFLVLDTVFFSEEFKDELFRNFDDQDAQRNGLLIHGDNFQGLNLINSAFQNRIKSVYLDPPYNTTKDDFVYKDSFRHSTWLSMMYDRLESVRNLMRKDASILISIDENEVMNLRGVFNLVFGEDNFLTDIIWEGSSKNDQKYFSISHEYILVGLKDKVQMDASDTRWLIRKEGLDDIYRAFDEIKKKAPGDYEQQSELLKKWYKNLPADHPALLSKHFACVEKRGIYFPADISKPAKGYYYDVIHPVTGKPCKKPKGGWRFIESTMKEQLENDLIHFGEDHETVPCRKSFLHETEYMSPRTVIYQDNRVATKQILDLFGDKSVFTNPKYPPLLANLLKVNLKENDIVLDAFGGSGTTAQAVMETNAMMNLNLSYVLLEMGDYFDTVLRPRIVKNVFSNSWKEGIPTDNSQGISHAFQYLRLESYEDTLNNIRFANRNAVQQQVLDEHADFREDYLLHYAFDEESRESLLSSTDFRNPFNRQLRIQRNGEINEQRVDLVETFNWLIGLRVQTRRRTRDFIEITGTAPDEARVLIIWRNCEESDNKALDKFFSDMRYNPKDREFDRIYVNGDNNLENLKTKDDRWKVVLIEQEFMKRMFENC